MLPDAGDGGPLRLLWLIDSLALGGAERLTAAFARAVDPARVRLTVCVLKRLGGNPCEAALRATGARVVTLESRGLRDVGAFRRLRRLVRDERVELVHAHLTDACIWGAALARLTRVPLVASLHVEPTGAPAWSRWGMRERLMGALLRRAARAVVAVSAAQRDAWARSGRLAAARLVVVHNGIDVRDHASPDAATRAAVRAALGLEPGARVAMTVAALRGEEKGIDVLLAALPAVLARVPEARLVVVGGGAMEPRFRALAREAGLDARVHFTGVRDDVPRLLGAADLFVLPSRRDAFPTAVLEAMAAGLPVVATTVGGVPEIVDTPRAGRLVPPGDAGALAAAMAALLADPAAAAAMGAAGRRRVAERFGVAAWLARLERVYAQALGAPAGVGAPAVELT